VLAGNIEGAAESVEDIRANPRTIPAFHERDESLIYPNRFRQSRLAKAFQCPDSLYFFAEGHIVSKNIRQLSLMSVEDNCNIPSRKRNATPKVIFMCEVTHELRSYREAFETLTEEGFDAIREAALQADCEAHAAHVAEPSRVDTFEPSDNDIPF
jgi:hypothetical protein